MLKDLPCFLKLKIDADTLEEKGPHMRGEKSLQVLLPGVPNIPEKAVI